jgi:hypothetical protein
LFHINESRNNIHPATAMLAFFIPPKKEQAFLQGGTFVFDGTKTVYAHYDESPGAHAELEEVLEFAYGRVKEEAATR